jgi:hypothetical protein
MTNMFPEPGTAISSDFGMHSLAGIIADLILNALGRKADLLKIGRDYDLQKTGRAFNFSDDEWKNVEKKRGVQRLWSKCSANDLSWGHMLKECFIQLRYVL